MPEKVVVELVVSNKDAMASLAEYDRGMALAGEVTAKTTATMTQSFSRQAAQFDRLAQAVNPVLAAQARLEQAVKAGNAAFAAGRASQEQVASVLGVYSQRLEVARKGTADLSHGVSLSSTQMMAAMHSARSMAEGLLLGASPVQILAQQFSHLSYVLSGPGGFAAVAASTRSGLTSVVELLGPGGLIVGGFIAAAGAAELFFHLLSSSSRDVDADLKRHKDLIDQVRAAYGEAGKAATDYSDKAAAAFKLKIGTAENLTNIKTDLQNALQGVRVQILEATQLSGGQIAKNAFGSLTPMAIAFAKAIKDGTPNIDAFEAALRGVALDPTINDGLHTKALRMLEMMEAVDRLTVSLKNAQGASQIVAGAGPLPDPGAASRAAIASIREQMAALHSMQDFGNRFDPTAANAAAAKQAEADARRQQEAVDKVIQSLQFQEGQLGRTAREQAIYNSVNQVGVDINSKAGQKIADAAGQLFDLQKAQKAYNDQLHNGQQLAQSFAETLISGLMRGDDLMASLAGSVSNLSSQLANSAITDLLSGNFIGAAVSGIGALITGIVGHDLEEKKKLKEAQQAWKVLSDEVGTFPASLAKANAVQEPVERPQAVAPTTANDNEEGDVDRDRDQHSCAA